MYIFTAPYPIHYGAKAQALALFREHGLWNADCQQVMELLLKKRLHEKAVFYHQSTTFYHF
jgi:hypothetical protein